LAIQHNKENLAKKILEKKPNIDIVNINGKTALMLAIKNNTALMLAIKNNTALMLAIKNNTALMLAIKNIRQTVQIVQIVI
jgi:ankyrin repeat protein